ncbi:MAG: cardiolipin synthase, partial [Pirellulaceae bacterium]|nr:cardiolipin synthase [Pirellulaceae bacterium]
TLNFELNLFVHAEEAVGQVHDLQQHYLARSRLATAADWNTHTLIGRLKVNLAKLFSPLL